MRLIALLIFGAAYVLMLGIPHYRYIVALIAAALYVASGILPLSFVPDVIDFNVILMLAGTMGIVSLFIESKMPQRISDILLERATEVRYAVVALSLFAGVVSAFIDNVATVLIIAPVGMAISKRLKISPVPVLIAVSVSSNLQGAATLVGDTTSILLGGYAGMDFLDFIFMRGRFGIFWAVELGALATLPVLMYIFRENKERITTGVPTEVQDYFPSYLLCALVMLLVLSSFIPDKPMLTNGMICVSLLIAGLLRELIRKRSFAPVVKVLSEIDFVTLILLMGLFVVIAGITAAGIIDEISKLFVSLAGDSVFMIYTLLVFGSVMFSAFIDNIPYVATMLPVVAGIAEIMGIEPYLLYFGLLTGATLGGNLTPVGASANITAIGILKRGGYEVKTPDFIRIGVPFTLAAVLTGYIFIWIIWGI